MDSLLPLFPSLSPVVNLLNHCSQPFETLSSIVMRKSSSFSWSPFYEYCPFLSELEIFFLCLVAVFFFFFPLHLSLCVGWYELSGTKKC